MNSITVADLHKLGEGITLIDVREPEEAKEVRVPFAKLIPLSEIADRIDEIPTTGAYIICHSGARSKRTVEYLAHCGTDAVNVDGGIVEWEATGLPVVRGSNS